ncbi:MAG: alpha/beta fold hydrolase [Chloroflexi bacterium]|nr:alpha/beta fold hydrolase [Chloroflexota bacterium]
MLKLYLFGPPRIEVDQQPIDFNLKKALAMLAYVAVEGNAHSRDTLATMFWADSDQSTARANLRRTLYRLNQAVGVDVLQATGDTISLNPDTELWVDVLAFNEHYGSQQWQAAADLFQDEFLSGFSLPDCLGFDDWQFFTRENLRQNLTHSLSNLIDQVSGEDAVRYLRQLIWLDPLDEAVHRRLMEVYAATGHRAAALRQYEECKRILDEELGAAPRPETNELYHTIRAGKPLATPRPQTQYVKSGEVHIAYQVLGDGPVDVVFVNGFISHLDLIWEDAPLVQFLTTLSSRCRLIVFDKRGVGLSDRIGHAPTLDDTMDDICAVMNAVGSERAVLFGVSEGGPASIVTLVTYPERVQGLILYGTGARFSRDSEYPWAPPDRLYRRWHELMLENWGTPVGIEIFTTSRANDPHMRDWWARLLRLGSSPGAIKAILDAMQQIDVRHLLPSIRVPTLVLHRIDDKVKWVGNGRYLASHIPGAQYVELEGDDHLWWGGHGSPVKGSS